MFKRIDHVAISVKDREKSIAFYTKNFGFEKYYEHDVPGVAELLKVVYLKLGDTVLEFEHWSGEKANKGYHFCLISDDFNGDYNRLKAEGIPIETDVHIPSPRTLEELNWKRVVFIGPDEELIEIRG